MIGMCSFIQKRAPAFVVTSCHWFPVWRRGGAGPEHGYFVFSQARAERFAQAAK